MSGWAVYRERDGTLHVDLERWVPSDGTVIRAGLVSNAAAVQCKRDIEAAEEHTRAVEAGQLDLFGGAE